MSKNIKSRKKNKTIQDYRYKDKLVDRFVNNLMLDGKKNLAFNIFYDALDIVEKKVKGEEKTPLEIWKMALSNIMPHIEVRSKRVGGSTFQIPVQIKPNRKISLAMKWLVMYSRKRGDKSMSLKLANEIILAYKEEGASYKKKVDTHKMAESNKAYSHFNRAL